MKKYIIPQTTVVEIGMQQPVALSAGDISGYTPGVGGKSSRSNNSLWDDDEDEWEDE